MNREILGRRLIAAAIVFGIAILPQSAHAHSSLPGALSDQGAITAGFVHPLTGLDHMLAMIAVGLWAAQIGGKARWIVPMTFVSVMMGGSYLALAGVILPFVESAIGASVLVLGLVIASVRRMPAWSASLVVGLFAIFHGHAHVQELTSGFAAVAYVSALSITTALLHLLGIAIGIWFQRILSGELFRIAGTAFAAIGTFICIGY